MLTDTRTEPRTATDPASAVPVLEVLGAVHDTLGSVIAGLDPSTLTGSQAAGLVEECAAVERLAQAGKLLAAGRVATCETWRAGGHRSAADWMASVTTCSTAEARALVETARRLVDQPQLDAALRAGALNADQATAVSDAVAADPTAESALLDEAERGSLASLREQCAKRKAAAQDDAGRADRLWKQRRARTRIGPDGAWELDARNTPDAGTIIEAALATFRELAFRASTAAGRRDSHGACTADALEMMAAAALGLTPTCVLRRPGDAPTSTAPGCSEDGSAPACTEAPADGPPPPPPARGGEDAATQPAPSEPGTGLGESGSDRPGASTIQPDLFRASDRARAPDPDSATSGSSAATSSPDRWERLGRPPDTVIPWDPVPVAGVRLPGGDRVKVIVRVDHSALVRGHTRAGETCDIVGLGPIPVASVIRLLATGDPFLAAVVTRGHDVASVVHLGRHPTRHQRTALEWRDAGCVISGCTNRYCEADHNEGWTLTHDTRTGDLALLCGPHHRKKTLGWRLVGAGTRRRLLPPVGHGSGADSC
jgi:hypothetical protein